MNFNLLYLLLFTLIIIACDKNNEKTESELLQQRILQLENADNYGAQPTFQAFTDACITLEKSTTGFVQKTTLDNLFLLREQWYTTATLFKRCEIYDIGDINNSFIQFRIHRWPTATVLLEDTLSSTVPVTTQYIDNLGSYVIGLGAIEYLLFKEDATTTLSTLQKNTKRLAYLHSITQKLQSDATTMLNTWENYSLTFSVATESRISGGQNQLTNTLLDFLEVSSKTRLGKAIGEDNGGILDTTKLEAYMSDASLDFIKNGFDEWKRCFYGNFSNSADSYGFDDYLTCLNNQALITAFDKAITDCDAALNQLSSLNNDVIQQPEKVKHLIDVFQNLIVLIKADLSSVLGVTITVNDSDGD